MRAFIAFAKKEFIENTRTYRLFIMGIIFLLLGIMNPLVAKITPTLLESLSAQGIQITIPQPTALDSWAQFFSNMAQMGMLTLLIIFSGIMANEIKRGTLIPLLTKGLKRRTVVLAKFTAASGIWTACYLLSFAVTFYYTAYFWPMHGMHHAFLSFFGMWLFGILLLAFLVFGGILFRHSYGSLLLTGGMLVAMLLVNIHPKLHKYNPITLSGGGNMTLLAGQTPAADFVPAMLICAGMVLLLVGASIALFNKKQL